jgi:hypothetical protein
MGKHTHLYTPTLQTLNEIERVNNTLAVLRVVCGLSGCLLGLKKVWHWPKRTHVALAKAKLELAKAKLEL